MNKTKSSSWEEICRKVEEMKPITKIDLSKPHDGVELWYEHDDMKYFSYPIPFDSKSIEKFTRMVMKEMGGNYDDIFKKVIIKNN